MSAFDKTDPSITASKFIQAGIRPSLIPILISYMTNRKMIVRFQGVQADPKDLIGGGPQGTLLGGLQYIITSDDCSTKKVKKEDRFKFFDDLHIFEFITLALKLIDYDVRQHVPSDITVNQ